MFIGLIIVLLLVLVLPFTIHKVEENLEVFLFVMGISASLISGILGKELMIKALKEPVMISGAVLVAGLMFHYFNKKIRLSIKKILTAIPLQLFVFIVVVFLGLASSVITAIIASLLLVEIINVLEIERRHKINLTVIACFSIGLGAALTPIGEPLATIAISKMGQDFWYLVRLLGIYIVPGILLIGVISIFAVKGTVAVKTQPALTTEIEAAAVSHTNGGESYPDVFIRAGKVYLFVMALVFLGEGFKPLIDAYVLGLSYKLLFWINMISAVLDNATLTAAELSISMDAHQVKSILLGLLISGGMLIPGNIPNIISANKLKIGSREWARLGVPMGLIMMALYFAILTLV
jgi:predicted cation transporter